MTLVDILPSIGRAAPRRFDPAIWPVTTHSDEEGRLCVGGVPLSDIADEFHTPTYVIDETDFRRRARRYRKTLRGVEVVYAGKSLLTTAVARWAREEGLGVDVCSAGELAVALAGGVEPARIIMHGNAKPPDELREAVRVGVGRIVLIEKLDETDFAGRYTVKRYAVHGARDEAAERTEKIRLEPLNKEFEAFDLEAAVGSPVE